jgi:hypothetical protein
VGLVNQTVFVANVDKCGELILESRFIQNVEQVLLVGKDILIFPGEQGLERRFLELGVSVAE